MIPSLYQRIVEDHGTGLATAPECPLTAGLSDVFGGRQLWPARPPTVCGPAAATGRRYFPVRRVEKLVERGGGNGSADVGEDPVGKDKQIAVDHASARVRNVGHVPLALLLAREQRGSFR